MSVCIPTSGPVRMGRRPSCGLIDMEVKDDAMTIFTKYQTGIGRRLNKPEALKMFINEFRLSASEADVIFRIFDKDANQVLSMWEYRQFYQTLGHSAHQTFELFRRLEVPGTGNIDIEAAFDALQEVETAKGKLDDEEIAHFLRTTAGESREIDLYKFVNMMSLVKVYRGR